MMMVGILKFSRNLSTDRVQFNLNEVRTGRQAVARRHRLILITFVSYETVKTFLQNIGEG